MGCITINATWEHATGNPVCGSVSYDVILSYPNGTIIIMTTTIETYYNFTGLMPDTSYTVTVAGRNDAGVGEPASVSRRTKGEQ